MPCRTLDEVTPLALIRLNKLNCGREDEWAIATDGGWRVFFEFRRGNTTMSGLPIIIEAREMGEAKKFHEVHPGVILKEEARSRGLRAATFVPKLRVPSQRIQEIVPG